MKGNPFTKTFLNKIKYKINIFTYIVWLYIIKNAIHFNVGNVNIFLKSMLNEDITLVVTLHQGPYNLSGEKHVKSCWYNFMVISTNTTGTMRAGWKWNKHGGQSLKATRLLFVVQGKSSRSMIQLSLSLSADLFVTEALQISEQ